MRRVAAVEASVALGAAASVALAAATVFAHACKMGLEGIVSKRKDSTYRSGRSADWLKMKNPEALAVKREAEEDWGRRGRR
jgi:ATP-dependent DNA ligase